MALNASDVNAGDDILAAHHNALIDDIEQHDHDGTDTEGVLTPVRLTITPGSAVIGLDINQDYDAIALNINSSAASTTAKCMVITNNGTENGLDITQVGILGAWKYGFTCYSNSVQNAAGGLANFEQDNAGASQDVVRIANDGSGNDLQSPNFTLKNGYIAPGGNEALRWDVVEFDLDGATPDSVAYTLDGLKCKGMYSIGYDVNTDDVQSYGGASTGWTGATHDGANLTIAYDSAGLYVAGDDGRIIIFTTA